MAADKNIHHGKWGGSNSQSVTAGGNNTSDAVTLSTTAVSASVQVKADNNGTPAAGDTINVKAIYSLGDPDADPDSSDEDDTAGHAQPLGQLDTNTDEPAIFTRVINHDAKTVKIRVESDAASNAITVSFQIRETRQP